MTFTKTLVCLKEEVLQEELLQTMILTLMVLSQEYHKQKEITCRISTPQVTLRKKIAMNTETRLNVCKEIGNKALSIVCLMKALTRNLTQLGCLQLQLP
jgi:hypothetical protein